MKIQNYGVNKVNPYQNQSLKTEKLKKSTVNMADQIEISSAAKDLQGIKSYSTDRAERIGQIKEQVESGNYKVDANKLASDLLRYYRK
ncbi:flagellar biosynthesis anti-sigma factor FlgM [Rummeliibacillus stabekisii]|uniref:flagellar biosynthesis anti-sigma factor FlgM n=1 Tax=Rummeliibacillus stabekisii TaxID=241244 RepID=UPI00116C2074|nr:flagellar biosynthesis anti-sigma factor FlgM [Rummeliibacillus stabekisii]MBB5170212.1 negative regulator of flagellin synthesis FlgM [Rummeliibacillus stabekisii]GEL04471.1 negative regulator of flagellin synthesis [Rummeliibacillus stabekisii]